MGTLVFALLLLHLTRGKRIGEEYKTRSYNRQIKGPESLDDRIAIVGAGPSGIHMAYLLKEKGFKNVEIFEKTRRLGGKSLSINLHGAVHEMGSVYVSSDYEENVYELIHKFGNSSLVAPPIASIWMGHNTSMPLPVYFVQRLTLKYPFLSNRQLILQYFHRITKYCALHRQLFGDYSGPFMAEPSAAVKRKIRGTFYEFLQRNDLEDLKHLFLVTFTLQGYGYLDEVPALYGLIWNTPRLLEGATAVFRGSHTKGKGLHFLSHGFQQLWKNMAEYSNVKINYNVDIKRIQIIGGVRKKIRLHYRQYSRNNIRTFDFLVWTPPAKHSLPVIDGENMITERKLFSNMVNAYYTTTLLESSNTQRSLSPVDWWFDNVYRKNDMSVWASRDSFSALHGFYGFNYMRGLTPTGSDDTTMRTSILYQYSRSNPNIKRLTTYLVDSFLGLGATYIGIYKRRTWVYFPRFTMKDVEKNYHWRVLDIQGRHNIWFVGGSVCFESIKGVIEYNELLVGNMKNPIGR